MSLKIMNFCISYVECINHSAVLTLFTHIVQCLSQCESAAAELNMLKDITAWTTSIKPRLEDPSFCFSYSVQWCNFGPTCKNFLGVGMGMVASHNNPVYFDMKLFKRG